MIFEKNILDTIFKSLFVIIGYLHLFGENIFSITLFMIFFGILVFFEEEKIK